MASTVVLPTGTSNQTLQITEGGSPGAYKLYTAAPSGTVIDVNNGEDTCINVQADYVIVRGVTCRGAKIDGLRIGNHRNVVIEGCDISEWGRKDPAAGTTITISGQNYPIPATLARHLDAGIHVDGPDSQQILIQGNRIHHPRYTASNWTQVSPYFSQSNYKSTHPQGANAVIFAEVTKGRHVIRWNKIGNDSQDLDHMFNDALLASEPLGNGFDGDGDIYGNDISDCWDDGIEAERGERNVRVWGNHFARMVKCVSVGYIWEGPLYVWGNVAEDLLHPNAMPAPYNGGHSPFVAHPPCFIPPPQEDKSENRNGILYVYQNTLLNGVGAGAGWAFNTWAANVYNSTNGTRLVSRNNIWQTKAYNGYFLVADNTGTNYFVRDFYKSYFDQDYDLHSGVITKTESKGTHTTQGEPTFAAGNGAGTNGLYQLAAGTPGQDDGVVLANFNDGFLGTAPDRGAQELGAPAMVFGIAKWAGNSTQPEGSIPNAPIGLAATSVSATQINLSWADASAIETGFTLQRKTGAGGVFATIATLAANAATYNNTGLTEGVNYYYRIRATGTAGNSAYSSEANATPAQPPVSGDFSFPAVADVSVDNASPSANGGSNVFLAAQRNGREIQTFLRFTVSGLPGQVTAAKLRLKESPNAVSNGSNCALMLRSMTQSWEEMTTTWNNKPGYTATTLGTFPRTRSRKTRWSKSRSIRRCSMQMGPTTWRSSG